MRGGGIGGRCELRGVWLGWMERSEQVMVCQALCRYNGGPKMKTQPTARLDSLLLRGFSLGGAISCDSLAMSREWKDCSLQVDGRFTGRGREHWHSNPFRCFFLFFADEN